MLKQWISKLKMWVSALEGIDDPQGEYLLRLERRVRVDIRRASPLCNRSAQVMAQTSQPRLARKDAQQNRAQILRAAARAFKRDGVDTSMDAIAKDAGVGPGTLYRHFPSKDSLLAALLDGKRYADPLLPFAT